MSTETIEICGQSFDPSSSYFSFEWPFTEIENMFELEKLTGFFNLTEVSLGSTNLDDAGLEIVCRNTGIENLNLQDTHISDDGIKYLSRLPNLKYLRLKENDQLTNGCIEYLNQISNLLDLQIHETSIDQKGLELLNISQLEDVLVNVRNENYSFEFLEGLSRRLSGCKVLAKGKAEFLNGEVLWSKWEQ